MICQSVPLQYHLRALVWFPGKCLPRYFPQGCSVKKKCNRCKPQKYVMSEDTESERKQSQGGYYRRYILLHNMDWYGSMSPEANTPRQEGKYPPIKVLQDCILKLLLHSVTFSQFSAHPLQDRQYAICHNFIIHRLFLPTTMWASIYPHANTLLYQSIRSI